MTRPQKTASSISVLAVLVCLAFPSRGEAIYFQAVVPGNWSDPTVWGYPAGSGLYPGSGGTGRLDGVSVNVPVFVDVSPTIGNGNVLNQPAVGILYLNAPLTIGAGHTLTLRGNAVAYSPLTINAGGGVLFDASISQVSYSWQGNSDSASFVANGTATARCAVKAVGAGAYVDTSYTNAAFHATFTDFTSFGVSSAISSSAATDYTLEDCTFNASTVQNTAVFPSTVKLSIQRNTWTNSISGNSMILYVGAAPAPGVAHIISGNVFDQYVTFQNGYTGLTITYNYFNNGFGGGGTTTRWASFLFNFVRQTFDAVPFAGDTYNNYFFFDSPGMLDCNAFEGCDVGNVLAYGNVFEARTAANLGCWAFIGSQPHARTTYTFRNNIALPNATANVGASGLLVVLEHDSPLINVVVEHNTGVSSNGFLRVGDVVRSTSAGQVLSCRSNLVWNNTPGDGNLIFQDLGSLPDVCPPQMMGYNGGFLLAASNPGANLITQPLKLGYGGMNPVLFSQTPIADSTDVNVNPNFVDGLRNLAKWDASLGGPGTADHALAQLMAIRQIPNSRYTTVNLLAYIRLGFQPTNTALRSAGHDRHDIGAMPIYIKPIGSGNTLFKTSPTTGLSPSLNPTTSAVRRRAR